MSVIEFEKAVAQIKHLTNLVALYMGGDPLVLNNLVQYLDILDSNGLKAEVSSSGFYTERHNIELFFHPAIKQINFSLNSFDKNSTKISLQEYLAPIFNIYTHKQKSQKELFINLRLWNNLSLDKGFNKEVLGEISPFFGVDVDNVVEKKVRVAPKIVVVFDDYFEWPSLKNSIEGDGFCYGLSSHFGILSNGIVVPCCLDKDGVIDLGNIFFENIDSLLQSKRALGIKKGFSEKVAIEELCRRCSYKNRFAP